MSASPPYRRPIGRIADAPEQPLTAVPAVTPELRHRAARYVAGAALDADDLRGLLSALGLHPAEGVSAP